MIIAVNTSYVTRDVFNGIDDFIAECFSKLAQLHPEHQFIYFCDKAIDEKYITSKNITAVAVGPQPKTTLWLWYRLNYKIPRLLRKHKAAVFVSTGYCSLRTAIPQCVLVNDLSFLLQPHLFSKRWLGFYKKNTVAFLHKAKTIITTSFFLKTVMVQQLKIDGARISVAHAGANKHFKPAVSWQQKDNTKQRYTFGKEYFLYSGDINAQKNLTALLKAFSFFKKRQQSNMQLVLASKNIAADVTLIKSLASYKYRDQVIVFEELPVEILAQLTATAYALVNPAGYDGAGAVHVEAMQSDTPVITSNTAAMPEICGEAAVYFAYGDITDMAEKMMLVFKDEDLRNQHIIKGRQQAGIYSWDKTAAIIWNSIEKCTSVP